MAKKKLWKTKDGRTILIREMDDNHLINAMKCLIKIAEVRRARHVLAYVCGNEPNGEGTLDLFEMEFEKAMNSTLEDFLPKIYDDLVNEFNKRILPASIIYDYIDKIKQAGLVLELEALAGLHESRKSNA